MNIFWYENNDCVNEYFVSLMVVVYFIQYGCYWKTFFQKGEGSLILVDDNEKLIRW
jgi:hypothetical protein